MLIAPAGLAADPALPARDLLLDADAVADRLSLRLGVRGPLPVLGAQLVRAKYRIGESLRVLYRLGLTDGDQLVSARVFPGGGSAAAADRAARRALPSGPLRAVLHDPDLDAVWWTFPNDRRLSGVGDLLEARVPAGVQGWLTSDVVEYAPERSLTVRAKGAQGTCGYVKLYAPDTVDVAALGARYRAIGERVRVPAVLGTARNVLALQPLAGSSWVDIADTGERVAALWHLGEIVGQLHGVAAPAGTPTFGRLEPARVRHAAELVACACPAVADRALRAAALLAAGPPPGEAQVLLHGDCHPKNALVDAGTVSLIDLDQAALGSPANDIGGLLALLHSLAARDELDRSTAEYLAEAFLAGYASRRPLPATASLRWHTAAALVAERAVRAVNRVNRPAIACLDELFSRSIELLEGRR